jgi:hypothetical protein
LWANKFNNPLLRFCDGAFNPAESMAFRFSLRRWQFLNVLKVRSAYVSKNSDTKNSIGLADNTHGNSK